MRVRVWVAFGSVALQAMTAAAAPLPVGKAPTAVADPWREVEAFYKNALARHHVEGSSLLLVRDGKVANRAVHGLQDHDLGKPVTEDTIFHWASITKTFTGIAILQLRDRGLLSLDDPIVKYLPELGRCRNPFGDMSQVKLRHLMSHSAGFRAPTWPWGEGKDWEPFEPPRYEQVQAMLPYTELLFAPGSRFSYSNPGRRLPGPHHRGADERRLRGLRRQERPPAPRHVPQLLRQGAAAPASRTARTAISTTRRVCTRPASTSTRERRCRTAG